MRIKKKIIFIAILLILVGVAFYPSPENLPIKYVERETGDIKIEKVVGENWLIWLYINPVGELSLRALVKRKFVSSYYGEIMDSPKSINKIDPFIKEYDVDITIAQKQEFSSFNDFFYRKLKKSARIVNGDSTIIISPADGKILVYADISSQDFIVKGYRFDVEEFLGNPTLAEKYLDGSLLIARLCPTDYHRFHFPVSGTISSFIQIDGDLLSVNPIAIKKIIEVFCINKREYTIISTLQFGDVIMAEVGATMVGSILQTYERNLAVKGEEKGYFKFGGSTVVLLFEKGRVSFDNDLLSNTYNNLETEVKMGERIAIGI